MLCLFFYPSNCWWTIQSNCHSDCQMLVGPVNSVVDLISPNCESDSFWQSPTFLSELLFFFVIFFLLGFLMQWLQFFQPFCVSAQLRCRTLAVWKLYFFSFINSFDLWVGYDRRNLLHFVYLICIQPWMQRHLQLHVICYFLYSWWQNWVQPRPGFYISGC